MFTLKHTIEMVSHKSRFKRLIGGKSTQHGLYLAYRFRRFHIRLQTDKQVIRLLRGI